MRWCLRYQNNAYLKTISRFSSLYIFLSKSVFVQLLYSQHWSFLTSMLSSKDDVSKTARWTPIIGGIASVAATASGWIVSPLVDLLKQRSSSNNEALISSTTSDGDDDATDGLTDLLFVATAVLLLASFCSDTAYRIAEENNCAPTREEGDKPSSMGKDDALSISLLKKSLDLFRKVPILGALCAEVLLYQSVASLLSHLFVSSTKEAIPVDGDRATYTGKVRDIQSAESIVRNACRCSSSYLFITCLRCCDYFGCQVYAWINGGSGVLQFGLLPLFLGSIGEQTRYLWLVMPCVVLSSAAWMVLKINQSSEHEGEALVDVMTASFCVVKILEYSLRGVLTEMVSSNHMQPSCQKQATVQLLSVDKLIPLFCFLL